MTEILIIMLIVTVLFILGLAHLLVAITIMCDRAQEQQAIGQEEGEGEP